LINILKSRAGFPAGDSAVIFVSLINKERLIYICSTEGGIDASKIVKLLNGQVGGKGGGKRDFAQGGSTDISKFNEIEKILEKMLKDLLPSKIPV
jgi:alanyl-tRNA synthetase